MSEAVHVVTPARLVDVLELASDTPRLRRGAVLQRQKSDSVSIFAGETLLAVAMLFPETPETREFCLFTAPGAARHMLALVRLAQLTLRPVNDSGVVILARVNRGNSAGRRMARLVGFLETDAEDGRLWIWRG